MDDLRAETVVRALAKISRNDIAAVDHFLTIEEIKDAVIHGTITKALKLGEATRIANKGKGKDKYAGDLLNISVKNENMSASLNGEVYVTIPDLICCINTETGTPITNPNYQNEMEVTVIILPAPVEFTSEKGLSIFGPNYAGIDAKYTPAVPQHNG
jgi:DUF917 family protein